MSPARTSTNGSRVTRADLEAAFGRALGEGESAARAAAPGALVIAAAAVLGVITVAYLAGRRKGVRRSAVVEIRKL